MSNPNHQTDKHANIRGPTATTTKRHGAPRMLNLLPLPSELWKKITGVTLRSPARPRGRGEPHHEITDAGPYHCKHAYSCRDITLSSTRL
eukprot:1196051-Prorocentrum_minimum.AAC.1